MVHLVAQVCKPKRGQLTEANRNPKSASEGNQRRPRQSFQEKVVVTDEEIEKLLVKNGKESRLVIAGERKCNNDLFKNLGAPLSSKQDHCHSFLFGRSSVSSRSIWIPDGAHWPMRAPRPDCRARRARLSVC